MTQAVINNFTQCGTKIVCGNHMKCMFILAHPFLPLCSRYQLHIDYNNLLIISSNETPLQIVEMPHG